MERIEPVKTSLNETNRKNNTEIKKVVTNSEGSKNKGQDQNAEKGSTVDKKDKTSVARRDYKLAVKRDDNQGKRDKIKSPEDNKATKITQEPLAEKKQQEKNEQNTVDINDKQSLQQPTDKTILKTRDYASEFKGKNSLVNDASVQTKSEFTSDQMKQFADFFWSSNQKDLMEKYNLSGKDYSNIAVNLRKAGLFSDGEKEWRQFAKVFWSTKQTDLKNTYKLTEPQINKITDSLNRAGMGASSVNATDSSYKPEIVLDEVIHQVSENKFITTGKTGTREQIAQDKQAGEEEFNSAFMQGILAGVGGVAQGKAEFQATLKSFENNPQNVPDLHSSTKNSLVSSQAELSKSPYNAQGSRSEYDIESFKSMVSEFNKDPEMIDRLSRVKKFDLAGYESATAKGQLGRVGDNLDSHEVIQNLFWREVDNIDRNHPSIKDNPAIALPTEIHKLIENLNSSTIQGLSGRQVLQHHISELRKTGKIPDLVIDTLEQEALKYLGKKGY